MKQTNFIKALESKDLNKIIATPKSDLHNHFPLGIDKTYIEKWHKKEIPSAPQKYANIQAMIEYTQPFLKPIVLSTQGFEYLVESSLKTALDDGITLLEMSFDCWFITKYNSNPELFIQALEKIHQGLAPDIDFRPEIGIDRRYDKNKIERWAYPLIDSGYFKSIDLYGIEDAKEPEEFIPVYQRAENHGMKLKAHTGEFLDANMVKRTCEVLHLNEVQHGISVAESESVMNWLKKNDIRLNICPTSNVKLKRVDNIRNHPIRVLFDSGVKVTVNSDDIFAFNQKVSQEYLDLYRYEVFTAEELDSIRLEGLRK